MSLTEEQQRTVDRVVSAKEPTQYELGALAGLLRQTKDPVIRQRIHETLARHGRQP